MEQYKLPSHNNPDKVFIVNRSELEGRLDTDYYKTSTKAIIASIRNKKHKKLRNILEPVKNGSTPDGGVFENSGVKYYRSQDFSMYDFKINQYITNEFNQKIIRSYVKKNDILLAVVGATLGQVGFIHSTDLEGNINQNVARLRVKEESFLPEYIAIYLDSFIGQLYIKRLATITTQAYLNNEQLKQIEIPYLHITNQQQIVDLYKKAYEQKQQKEVEAKALLDSIDSYLLGELGITLPEKDNSLQKRVFTTQFSEIGGGRLDPLSLKNNISDFLTGKYDSEKMKNIVLSFKSGFGAGKQDQVLDDSGIIQIRPTNIDEQGTLKFDKNVYLPVDVSYSESDYINVDDILFNNTNSQEWVGKTAILKEELQLLYSNHITKITVNKDVAVPDYIWLILNSYQKNKIFYSICTNWNNQSGVGLDLLRSLPIPLPPLEKQNEIAQHIQSIRDQAKQLKNDAKTILKQAKQEVELMILQ